MASGPFKARGRPSPVFGPSKFDVRRKNALQIVAGAYIEPSQTEESSQIAHSIGNFILKNFKTVHFLIKVSCEEI